MKSITSTAGKQTLGGQADRRLRRTLLELFSTKLPTFPHRTLTATQRRQIRLLLEPGDILLDSNYAFLLPQVGNRLFFGSTWIHAAIYIGDGKLVDAGRKLCVMEFPLEKFLDTTGLAIYRPKYQTAEDTCAMIAYAKSAIGAPFNLAFDQADEKSFYCGQLVANALQSMPHPITLALIDLFGRKLVPPASVSKSSEIQCVWSSHPQFLTNVGAHWPSLVASIAGSSYSHVFGISSFAGGLCGFFALAFIANFSKWSKRNHGLTD